VARAELLAISLRGSIRAVDSALPISSVRSFIREKFIGLPFSFMLMR